MSQIEILGKKVTQKNTPVIGSKLVDGTAEGTTAKVFFSRHIDAEHLIKLYSLVNDSIYG